MEYLDVLLCVNRGGGTIEILEGEFYIAVHGRMKGSIRE